MLVLLPLAGAGSPEDMRVVPAREIMDKIERAEPVEYDHVIVKGDLDLRGLDLPRGQVGSRIAIECSAIVDNVYFRNSIFNHAVGFNGSTFNSTADFRGSSFTGDVNFRKSKFNGYVSFKNSVFNCKATFLGSNFTGTANLLNSTFNCDADFRNSHFNDIALFQDSHFNGIAQFWDSQFNDTANFKSSHFNNTADFWDSVFNGMVQFWDSHFDGTADFKGVHFNDDVHFEFLYFNNKAVFKSSYFNGTASFLNSSFSQSDYSSAQFNKQVSFNDAHFKNSTSFNNSIFKEDPLFEGTSFDGPLFLTRAMYERLYVRWNNIKELGYDDAAYLTLLENFKKLGYLEDYDACYYEYRRLHRDQDWGGGYHSMPPWEEEGRKWIDLGLQYTYGYGKKPILPLLWSAGTVLLFAAIWRAFGQRNGNHRGLWEKYGQKGARQTSGRRGLPGELRALGEAMLFSATVFLSGTRLFVDPPALPVLEGRLASHARAFFIAERVLGALFSILFFLAIGGTVVR